jgi:hypothetical protein
MLALLTKALLVVNNDAAHRPKRTGILLSTAMLL